MNLERNMRNIFGHAFVAAAVIELESSPIEIESFLV